MKAWTAVVGVVVRDKERSKRFFRDKVGMKVIRSWGHWLMPPDGRSWPRRPRGIPY